MSVIGISCDNDKVTYVVITGSVGSPKILESETYALNHIEKGKLLDSAVHRIANIIEKYSPEKAAVLIVDKVFKSTKTHPPKHQLEGVIIHKFYKAGINCMEYNRQKLLSILKEKLKITEEVKPSEVKKKIIDKIYGSSDFKKAVSNDSQREAFAIALTQL